SRQGQKCPLRQRERERDRQREMEGERILTCMSGSLDMQIGYLVFACVCVCVWVCKRECMCITSHGFPQATSLPWSWEDNSSASMVMVVVGNATHMCTVCERAQYALLSCVCAPLSITLFLRV